MLLLLLLLELLFLLHLNPFFLRLELGLELFFNGFSLLVSLLSFSLLVWHHGLISTETRRRHVREKQTRGAPAGTIESMATVPYNTELFGAEDGKRYPGECPICLGEWEQGDEIKVPACGHAFHKACLGQWLQRERTCVLCRRDVTDIHPARNRQSRRHRWHR